MVIRGGYSKVFDRVGVGPGDELRRRLRVRHVDEHQQPVRRRRTRQNPAVRFVNTHDAAADDAGGAARRVPADAAAARRHHHDEHRRHARDAVGAHGQRASSAASWRATSRSRAGYVGRFGRDLLVRRDIAMPLNLVDTSVGDGLLHRRADDDRAAQAAGIHRRFGRIARLRRPARHSPTGRTCSPARPAAALTATQAIARAFMQNGPDWITALYDMDTSCSPACSMFGPYAYFAEQYDSLAAISSIGRSNYNAHDRDAAQAVRRRLQFDINYTLSKSEGHGIAGRARQRLRQLRQRRQLRLPDQLVRSGAELRHVRLRRAAPGQHQLALRSCRSASGKRYGGERRRRSSTRSSATGRSRG